jgi:DNA-binding MarR family transcriptional regulator
VTDRAVPLPAVPAGGCADALAEDLGWCLGVVFRAYVKAAHDAVADLPGGPRGYQILAAAAHGTVNSQLALAQHLGVDRTVMTYLIDDLESGGLIQRCPDPADRRARRIIVTERGKKLLMTLDRRLQDAEARLLDPLDEKGSKTFRSQVRLLAAQINAVDPVESPCEVETELSGGRARAGAARPS